MHDFILQFEEIFESVITVCTLAVEVIGVIILMWTVIKNLIHYIHRDHGIQISLANGITLALEIMIVGEILNTVRARELNELIFIGVLIALRVALTFVLHWESKMEEEKEKEEVMLQELKEHSKIEK